MSTELPSYLIEGRDDADRAIGLLLAGLPPVDEHVYAKLRQAYLFGRADQAAQNYDSLLKSIKGDKNEG